jgi:hypothetical protein
MREPPCYYGYDESGGAKRRDDGSYNYTVTPAATATNGFGNYCVNGNNDDVAGCVGLFLCLLMLLLLVLSVSYAASPYYYHSAQHSSYYYDNARPACYGCW